MYLHAENVTGCVYIPFVYLTLSARDLCFSFWPRLVETQAILSYIRKFLSKISSELNHQLSKQIDFKIDFAYTTNITWLKGCFIKIVDTICHIIDYPRQHPFLKDV